MKIEINIERKHLLYLVVFTTMVGGVGLVVGYGGDSPTVMGHSWGEITCIECIFSGNISTGAVTSDEILDKTIKNDDIADDAKINGSKIDAGTIPDLALESGGGGGITTYKIQVKGHMEGPTCKSKKKTWTCPSGNITLINAPGPRYVEPSRPSYGDACPYSVSEGTITINALVSWYDGWTWGQLRGVATSYTPSHNGQSCGPVTCTAELQCVTLEIVDYT